MKILDTTLIEHIFDYEVILVPMGPYNSFYRGFSSWIKPCFPNLKPQECKLSPYGNRNKIGTILPIKESGIIFCMCYIHDGGYNKKHNGDVFLDYNALESCLKAVASKYKNKRIATIKMGVERGGGNGDEERITKLFETYFGNMDNVDLYLGRHCDFNWQMLQNRKYHYRRFRRKEINREELRYELRKISWQREHGIFEPMPEDYKLKLKKKMDLLTVKKSDLEKKKKN